MFTLTMGRDKCVLAALSRHRLLDLIARSAKTPSRPIRGKLTYLVPVGQVFFASLFPVRAARSQLRVDLSLKFLHRRTDLPRRFGAGARGGPWIAAQPEETLYVSILTIAEGDQGLANLDPNDPERARLATKWQAIEERFEGRVLPLTNAIARRWGAISGVLKKSGRQAAVIDTMLAATALEHDLYLVTRNTNDAQGTGASLFNPWKDNPANFPLS